MEHNYNLNDSSYMFDVQLIKTNSVKMPTLSENMNIDISQAQAVLEKIKGNRITVWNENSFSKLVGSLLIMGFVILIYMYKRKYKNKEMHENKVVVNYYTEIEVCQLISVVLLHVCTLTS